MSPIGNFSLVKIEGIERQQIILNADLYKITANYTVMCSGSYSELEKAVYDQLEERSRMKQIKSAGGDIDS